MRRKLKLTQVRSRSSKFWAAIGLAIAYRTVHKLFPSLSRSAWMKLFPWTILPHSISTHLLGLLPHPHPHLPLTQRTHSFLFEFPLPVKPFPPPIHPLIDLFCLPHPPQAPSSHELSLFSIKLLASFPSPLPCHLFCSQGTSPVTRYLTCSHRPPHVGTQGHLCKP